MDWLYFSGPTHWSCATKFPSLPGLWLVKQFLCIYKQIIDCIEVNFCRQLIMALTWPDSLWSCYPTPELWFHPPPPHHHTTTTHPHTPHPHNHTPHPTLPSPIKFDSQHGDFMHHLKLLVSFESINLLNQYLHPYEDFINSISMMIIPIDILPWLLLHVQIRQNIFILRMFMET